MKNDMDRRDFIGSVAVAAVGTLGLPAVADAAPVECCPALPEFVSVTFSLCIDGVWEDVGDPIKLPRAWFTPEGQTECTPVS